MARHRTSRATPIDAQEALGSPRSPQSPAGSPRHAEPPVARGRSPPAEAGVRARLCASSDPTEASNSIALVATIEGMSRCQRLVLRHGGKIVASLFVEELNVIVAGKHMVELSVSGAELAVFLAFEDGASFDQFHHMLPPSPELRAAIDAQEAHGSRLGPQPRGPGGDPTVPAEVSSLSTKRSRYRLCNLPSRALIRKAKLRSCYDMTLELDAVGYVVCTTLSPQQLELRRSQRLPTPVPPETGSSASSSFPASSACSL